MKRLINVRVPLFCAVGLILGIIACKELLCGDLYFGVILLALLVVSLVVGLIVKRAVKAFALLLCFALVGFGLARLSYRVVQGNEVVERQVHLQGRVCDLGRNREQTSHTYYLENCVDLDSGDTFNGRVQLTYFIYGDGTLQVGEVVTFSGTLYSTYPVKTTVNSFEIRNRIYYELVDAQLDAREAGKVKFDEKARQYIYEVAMEYAPQNGGIIYALLTGDRNAIPSDTVSDFQRAGTIHLLAVSGLHIGFVVAMVCLALKRLNLKPLVECAIVLVPLLFYAYICGFSPSVTRAVVMTVCLYLTRAVSSRYDLLTSLSISALFILFLTPFTLFDAGFQLSFLSVFGIATLHAPVMRRLARRKINRFVRYFLNALFLSMSCSLATLFTLAVTFAQVPLLGVFVNLFAIPLITVVFVLSVFAMLPWVLHYLLVPTGKILVALVWLNRQVSSLSFATVSFTALAISAAIVAVLMFVIGGFVNLSKLLKRISCIACALLLAATVVLAMVPRRAAERVFVSCGYNDSVVAAMSTDGNAAIVGSFSDNSATAYAVQFLMRYSVSSCTLVLVDYSNANVYAVELALDNLPVDKVYTLTQKTNEGVAALLSTRGVNVVYQLPNTTTGSSVCVLSIYDGTLAAVSVTVGEIDVCIEIGDGRQSAFELWRYADVYVTASGNVGQYSEAGVSTFSRYQTTHPYNYGANKYGNFTIRQKDDRIIFSFS